MTALGTTRVAIAQDKNNQPTAELGRLRLSCDDFTRNRDNTWSPTHSIVVGVMAVSPTASFRAGEIVGGADLGAILDTECNAQSGQPSTANPAAAPNR
jgi:hypothetical protein